MPGTGLWQIPYDPSLLRTLRHRLEDDSIEISTLIDKFKEIGLDNLLVSVKGLDAFDKFIIKYLYQGIG